MRFHRSLLIALGALALASCSTMSSSDLAKFGSGVDSTKTQLDSAFQSVDDLASEDEIAQAATRPTLNENSVVTVIKPDDLAKWDLAFSNIDKYVTQLTSLLSPNMPSDFETSVVGFATQLQQTAPKAVPSNGNDTAVATAFTELGRLLIEASAQKDAMKIAQKTDPSIQSLFKAMEDVIGSGPSEGLRGTTRAHWLLRMADDQIKFLSTTDVAARKQIVIDYFALRDKRDAQDLQLASLRESLNQLAASHAALAKGSPVELGAAINALQTELAEVQSLHDRFTTALGAKSK
jgi:hypothetical protein